MGGYGSGFHLRSDHPKRAVESCIEFRFGKLMLRKRIEDEDFDNYWSMLAFYHKDNLVFKSKAEIIKHYDGTFLYLKTKKLFQPILLFKQKTNNGGSFWMMRCPDCDRKVLKLFLKPPRLEKWACYKCHDLIYTTSKWSRKPSSFHFHLAHNLGWSIKKTMAAINASPKGWRKKNYYMEYLNSYNYGKKKEENEMEQTSIKLSKWELQRLDKLSSELDLSRAEIIRRAIDQFLDRREEREVQLKSK